MSTTETTLPLGVVLAGGRGRRFGGVDKGFLTLAGKPLIAHVMDRIVPQVGELAISTSGDSHGYRALGLPVFADRPRSMPANGPLVGLTTVFAELRERGDGASAVLSVPVDTPFLPADLVRRLSAALGETGALVAYAAGVTRDHPIIALWAPPVREAACALFEREPELSLHGMMARLGGLRVVFATDAIDPFFNINTPQDLETAERIVRAGARSA